MRLIGKGSVKGTVPEGSTGESLSGEKGKKREGEEPRRKEKQEIYFPFILRQRVGKKKKEKTAFKREKKKGGCTLVGGAGYAMKKLRWTFASRRENG